MRNGCINQERFTLASDDTIEQLRNGAKIINTSKSTSFWLCVEDVVQRKEHSFGNALGKANYT